MGKRKITVDYDELEELLYDLDGAVICEVSGHESLKKRIEKILKEA